MTTNFFDSLRAQCWRESYYACSVVDFPLTVHYGYATGDAVVVEPAVDGRKDPKTGHLYFDLAVTSVDELNVINPYAKKNFKVVPSEVVPWNAKVKAPGGELEAVSGKVILPGDVAAVLGSHLFFDIAFGSSATGANASFWKGHEGRSGHTPIRCSMRSNCAHLEALAYLNFRKKRLVLLQPMTAEVRGISDAYTLSNVDTDILNNWQWCST